MREDNIHKDNQESYCAVSEECVCGTGRKRAVNKGELYSLDRKKKTGWHSESKEWRRSSMTVPVVRREIRKLEQKGVSMGENQSKNLGLLGGQVGKGENEMDAS